MRRHFVLVGLCGWMLLIFLFVNKFLSSRVMEDYTQGYTSPSAELVKPLPVVIDPEKSDPETDKEGAAAPLTEVDWQLVSEKRMELLNDVCQNTALRNLTHIPISKFVLDRIFVCDKQKILFCQTPKVGNTQWKKVLIVLNGGFSSVEEIPENIVHDHDKNGLPRLSSLSPQEISIRLNTYFKFLIVRDPFERLISAFKDKFVKNPRFEPWYKHDIAPAIIRKYRKSHRDSEGTESGLRFEDFVRYLGDAEGRRHLDRQFGEHIIHWLTYTELCAPCAIHYSVVGHHETLEKDVPYILREAGIEQLVSYPHIPPGITRYNKTKVERYFSGISKRDISRLYKHYLGDFQLFGYQHPYFLLS